MNPTGLTLASSKTASKMVLASISSKMGCFMRGSIARASNKAKALFITQTTPCVMRGILRRTCPMGKELHPTLRAERFKLSISRVSAGDN